MTMPTPPTERTPDAPERHSFARWLLPFAVVGGAVLALILGLEEADSGSEPERTPHLDPIAAEIACESYVTDRLKAPATAEFTEGSVSRAGTGVFVVDGAVDAQNSFGAMIRTPYMCTVQLSADGASWSLVSLDVEY